MQRISSLSFSIIYQYLQQMIFQCQKKYELFDVHMDKMCCLKLRIDHYQNEQNLNYRKYLIMSSLYFWGKPITTHLFEKDSNGHSIAIFEKGIQQISCGEKHCVMIIGENVVGIGDNLEGQLGDQSEQSQQPIFPIMINHNHKIQQIACGWNHTLLLDCQGSVFSAGRGEHGQLGRGKAGSFNSFGFVIKGAKMISAGKDHSLAVCGSKVMGWGNSREGQLGLLSRKNYYYPHELNVYPTTYVFAGAKYSLFVTSKGVFGTGINQNCQLGLGHQTDIQMPRRLAIEQQIITVSGGNYCAAKTAEQEWYLWGSGGFGVFKYPTKMSFLKGGESVTMGLNFGLLSKNGQIWVWGSNRWGELGIQEQFKDYAYEAEEISALNLTGFATGCNFMIGFKNESKVEHFPGQKQSKNSVSECNEDGSCSNSKDLFKKFQKSSLGHSGSSRKDFKNMNSENQWSKLYEIQQDYDLINNQEKQSYSKVFHQKQKQPSHPEFKKSNLNGGGYMTWQGRQTPQVRRVKLTQSLKSLTSYQWSSLEKQNQSLKERLQNERLEKQKIRSQYMNFLNMNEDNKIMSKIIRLESMIREKDSTKTQKHDAKGNDTFEKKLNSLKNLLQSAL